MIQYAKNIQYERTFLRTIKFITAAERDDIDDEVYNSDCQGVISDLVTAACHVSVPFPPDDISLRTAKTASFGVCLL